MSQAHYSAAYAENFRTTVRFLISKGVSPGEAEQLAQDAWGKGWMKREQLRNPAAVLPWINSIALNLLRANARRAPYTNELPITAVEPKVDVAGIDAKRIVGKCKPKDKQLLRGTVEGYTSKELAKTLSCSPTNVRVRLLRLRRRLQAELKGKRAGRV